MNLTTKILQEGRSATQEELAFLYTNLVCPLCPLVCAYIKYTELARLVVIELFYGNVIRKDKEKGDVVNQLSLLVGVTRQTVYRWINETNFEEYAQFKNGKNR